MKVLELIKLLQEHDPEAYVLMPDEPFLDRDRNIVYGLSFQSIAEVELGWSDNTWPHGDEMIPVMESDISFHSGQEPDPERLQNIYSGNTPPLVKAVRIVGINQKPTADRGSIAKAVGNVEE